MITCPAAVALGKALNQPWKVSVPSRKMYPLPGRNGVAVCRKTTSISLSFTLPLIFQLDLVLREIEEGEVGFGLPPPVQGVLPGWVTFWRRSCCGPQFVLNHALTTFLCCVIRSTKGAPCARCS